MVHDKSPKKRKLSARDAPNQPEKKNKRDNKERSKDPSHEQWSKSKKKRMRQRKALLVKSKAQESQQQTHNKPSNGTSTAQTHENSSGPHHSDQLGVKKDAAPQVSASLSSSSALQKSFRERLSGSRFRLLNQELYTTNSRDSFRKFQDNPSLFDEYHTGFRHQVNQWPVNPINVLVGKIKKWMLAKNNQGKKLPKSQDAVVADFGCGDAELAKKLLEEASTWSGLNMKVHSFDLVAAGPNAELITPCDIMQTPLSDGSVDVGVFCLSLMGTNLADFIREAHRVLKPNGILHIAEVRSRFEVKQPNKKGSKHSSTATTARSVGTADDDDGLQEFLGVLEKLGFQCLGTDRSNKMFLLMELKKDEKIMPPKNLSYTARPCIYKRR
jgi:ribosomal RNA-processing protein 8